MPAESPRIAELRRRIEADPASIAFAQLAEEYRRAGNFEAAEQCCRSGLIRHPGYLSARVTLGRTLIELGRLDQAEQELQLVLNSAPDNLAAIRGMAEIHQRRGHLESALEYYRRALPLARHDPDLEETVSQIKRELGAVRPAPNAAMLSFAEAQNELLSAASRMPDARRPEPPRSAAPPPPPSPVEPQRSVESQEVRTDAPTASAPISPSFARPDASTSDSVMASPFEPEVSIDFDSLLKSLGAADYTAPPMVEALLTEPAPAAPRPEPVLPELPLEKPPADAHAALRRGLKEFDAPASARKEPDASFPPSLARPSDASFPPSLATPSDASFGEAGGEAGGAASSASSPSLARQSEASFGAVAPKRPDIASREGGPVAPVVPEYRTEPVAPVAPAKGTEPVARVAPDVPVIPEQRTEPVAPDAPVDPPSLAQSSDASFGGASRTEPSASASARPESQASYGETSPKRPETESREGGPEVSKEQVILDELEAWLAAIKR